MVPATSGPKIRATGGARHGPKVFFNRYFRMKSHGDYDIMEIVSRWCVPPPEGLGRYPTMSKPITASTVGCGEDRTRSQLLLRAWMLWRVRYIPGWVENDKARHRLFIEETDALYDSIRRLQPQKHGLMGHSVASKMLHDWVPDIEARLRDLKS